MLSRKTVGSVLSVASVGIVLSLAPREAFAQG
jgi:hypothetical protein